MQSPLLILGASARAATQSAIRGGCGRVWAADLFADADLRTCAEAVQVRDYPRGLISAMEQAPDGPWMYTGALENHPRLVDQLGRLRPLLGCPGAVLRRVRDPRRLAEVVRSAGLTFPETRFDSFPAGEVGRWLCKPFRSAAGANLRLAKPSDNRPRRRQTTYFQRMVDGLPASAVFVGDGNRAVLVGATRQLIGCDWCGASGFQYAGSLGPLALDEPQDAELQRLGDRLAENFGLVGLFGVDLLLRDDELAVLEVNPRYTASVEVLERALDISTIPWHLAACRGGGLPLRPTCESPAIVGKAILFALRPLTVRPKESQRWLAERAHSSPAPIADIPVAGTRLEVGQPVFTIFAQANNFTEVKQQLQANAAQRHAVLARAALDA
ncbi:MAG: ATP-grasp domain-containing protein [Pirellulaceae bacterium]